MKTKSWTEYLEGPETEARYELDIEKGEVVGARVVGYFTDEFGGRHEFVRWDSCHGGFHKHRLYERKQGREDIDRPLREAFNDAKAELRSGWRRYKREYVKNHIKDGREKP